MFTSETPVEIWADYLEDKGVNVSQLRAWIETGLQTNAEGILYGRGHGHGYGHGHNQ